MKLPTRFQKLIMLALTLLAFLLRAYRLDYQSYWIDEAWTVYFTNLPLDELWHLLQTTEIKPPFYFSSALYWVKLFGDGEYALRFYSLIFGVMAIPFTYRLGRALGDDRLGLVAALLLAVAPYQVWHSQEARLYSILTAAAAMSMWGFVQVWQRSNFPEVGYVNSIRSQAQVDRTTLIKATTELPGSYVGWRSWLIYIIGTEWAIMTHYHGAMLIGIQGLFLLLTWRRHWRGYWRWGLSLVVMFLLYLPWLLFGSSLLQSYVNWIEQPTLWEAFARSAIAYSLNELVPSAQAIPLALVFVMVYGLGLVYASLRRWGSWQGWEMLAFLVSFTIAPHLAAWLYGEFRTVAYLERYMILVQIGYLLAVAVGIVGIFDFRFSIFDFRFSIAGLKFRAAQLLGVVVLLLLVGINGWVLYHHYTDPGYAKENWRAIAQKIDDFAQPGDAILLTGDGGENAFNFYYHGDLPVYYDFNLLPPTHPDYKKGRKGLADLAEIMGRITTGHDRLWYTPYGVEIDPAISDWLAHHAYPAWHNWIGGKQLALYSTSAASLDRVEPLQASFFEPSGQGLRLVEVALPGEPVAAGDLLPLSLTWQTETPLGQDYQLSLRLINQYSDIFAQADWPPLAAGNGPTSTWPVQTPIIDRRSLWLPPETPPGDYLLQGVVYVPATGQTVGQPVTLAGITVSPAKTIVPVEALAIPNLIPEAKRAKDSNPALIGYILPEEIQPGQEMWLWLYWQAQTIPIPGSTFWLNLQSEDESISQDFPLASSVGPLATWQPGQVRRAVVHLPTSPRLDGATAQVRLTLASPSKRQAEIILSDINLATRKRTFELPLLTHSTSISLGHSPQLTLLGYEAALDSLRPGDDLELTLYWRAEAEMSTNYTVFTQLLDPANQVVAQVDQSPQGGAAPTTTWLPGEIVADSYRLSLPATLPPGDYRLITGMYDPVTGDRLPVALGGDFVALGQVKVE